MKHLSLLFVLCSFMASVSAQSFVRQEVRPTVAILGDSYSTFDGYIPAGNQTYYSTSDWAKTGVVSVKQTWWWQVVKEGGFKLGVKNVSGGWQVHLYATNQKRTIKEMYVTIGKNYYPKTIKMRQSNGWTTINVSNFKPKNLSDSMFRFNAKDYPHAEVIDLR